MNRTRLRLVRSRVLYERQHVNQEHSKGMCGVAKNVTKKESVRADQDQGHRFSNNPGAFGQRTSTTSAVTRLRCSNAATATLRLRHQKQHCCVASRGRLTSW